MPVVTEQAARDALQKLRGDAAQWVYSECHAVLPTRMQAPNPPQLVRQYQEAADRYAGEMLKFAPGEAARLLVAFVEFAGSLPLTDPHTTAPHHMKIAVTLRALMEELMYLAERLREVAEGARDDEGAMRPVLRAARAAAAREALQGIAAAVGNEMRRLAYPPTAGVRLLAPANDEVERSLAAEAFDAVAERAAAAAYVFARATAEPSRARLTAAEQVSIREALRTVAPAAVVAATRVVALGLVVAASELPTGDADVTSAWLARASAAALAAERAWAAKKEAAAEVPPLHVQLLLAAVISKEKGLGYAGRTVLATLGLGVEAGGVEALKATMGWVLGAVVAEAVAAKGATAEGLRARAPLVTPSPYSAAAWEGFFHARYPLTAPPPTRKGRAEAFLELRKHMALGSWREDRACGVRYAAVGPDGYLMAAAPLLTLAGAAVSPEASGCVARAEAHLARALAAAVVAAAGGGGDDALRILEGMAGALGEARVAPGEAVVDPVAGEAQARGPLPARAPTEPLPATPADPKEWEVLWRPEGAAVDLSMAYRAARARFRLVLAAIGGGGAAGLTTAQAAAALEKWYGLLRALTAAALPFDPIAGTTALNTGGMARAQEVRALLLAEQPGGAIPAMAAHALDFTARSRAVAAAPSTAPSTVPTPKPELKPPSKLGPGDAAPRDQNRPTVGHARGDAAAAARLGTVPPIPSAASTAHEEVEARIGEARRLCYSHTQSKMRTALGGDLPVPEFERAVGALALICVLEVLAPADMLGLLEECFK